MRPPEKWNVERSVGKKSSRTASRSAAVFSAETLSGCGPEVAESIFFLLPIGSFENFGYPFLTRSQAVAGGVSSPRSAWWFRKFSEVLAEQKGVLPPKRKII